MTVMSLRDQVAILDPAAEEGSRLLHELFGAADPSAPRTRGCRKYVLEYRDGKPIFTDAISAPLLPRSELELMFDQIFDEVFDNNIVPEKLAKAFPGSKFQPGR